MTKFEYICSVGLLGVLYFTFCRCFIESFAQNLTDPDTKSHPDNYECGKVPLFVKKFGKSFNSSDQQSKEAAFKILQGTDAIFGEYPFIVKIDQCDKKDIQNDKCDGKTNFCTGSLLNSRWVLTAGHCTRGMRGSKVFRVTFGLYNVAERDTSAVSMVISKWVLHPDFSHLDHDLLLLKTERKVEFNEFIQPICMIDRVRNTVDYTSKMRCFNAGYGATDTGKGAADKLQKIEITTRTMEYCQQHISYVMRRNTVCIGPLDGKIGSACVGDSGGPNMCYNESTDRWEIFAAVSYGPQECQRKNDEPWLYFGTDLANYRSWINKTISDLS